MNEVDCNSVLDQLSDYIDSDARDELCKAITAHLTRCPDCKIMVDSVKKTIVLYQNGDSGEMPVHATVELNAALHREYAATKRSRSAD